MWEHDATEVAYKNGYEKGYHDALSALQTMFAVHFGTYTDKDMTPISKVFSLMKKFKEEVSDG